MVKRMEFYNVRDFTCADACLADGQRNEPGYLADPELEHGNGCGDI